MGNRILHLRETETVNIGEYRTSLGVGGTNQFNGEQESRSVLFSGFHSMQDSRILQEDLNDFGIRKTSGLVNQIYSGLIQLYKSDLINIACIHKSF